MTPAGPRAAAPEPGPRAGPRARALRRCGALLCGAAALALVAALGSCLRLPAAGPGGPAQARREYDAAVDRIGRDRAEARARLEAFLDTRPRSRLADDAALLLARLELEEGDRDAAVRHLAWLVEEHPRADRSDAARLLLAESLLELGRTEEAREALGRIRLSRLLDDQRARAFRLNAELGRASGDRSTQLRWLARLRERVQSREEQARLDAELDALLARLELSEVARAAAQLPDEVGARLRLRAAELALGDGGVARAQMLLGPLRGEDLEDPEARRLALLQARLQGQSTVFPAFAPGARARGTIGVAVPLSGPFAGFGEDVLNGVLLAAGIFGGGDERAPSGSSGVWSDGGAGEGGVRVLVRDSHGRPPAAAAAVRSLAEDDRVAAVVGPLLSSEAEAAGSAAEEAGLPVVTLTGSEEVARGRPYVLRIGTTHRAQAEELVEYAVRTLGATSFAILYPDDRYGRGVKNLFWDVVEAHGGEVVGVSRYEPGAVDFAAPIRRLVGYELLSPEARRAAAERERLRRHAAGAPPEEAERLLEEAEEITGPDGEPLPPIVDFDVLFIPDSHERVGLIAPQLAFHEVSGVRLFGPDGWYHPELLRIGGKHLEGSVFAEIFYPASRLPYVAEFTRRYREVYGEEPTDQAAQAFDAASLVLVQLVRGLRSRDSLRAGLVATYGYPGVSGRTSIDPDGNARKRPYLLGVEDGRIVPLEAPESAPPGPEEPRIPGLERVP